MNRQRIERLVMMWCLVLLPAAARAQALGSGTIAGVVKDTSGAVMPGVTVEAASPALIEKVRSVVTDDQGLYKIVSLVPGTYTVTFTLPGFSSSDIPGLSGANVGIGAEGEVQIVQIPGYVLILAQSNNAARIIPLDGGPHLSPNIPQWLGDARGRWEGNTLVIEGTNFNDQLRFLGSTGALRLVERLTRVDADTLLYQLTVEDPTTWTRPWSAELQWPKTAGPIYEFACHEANYGLLNVLTGERVTEEAKKKVETK